MDFQASYLAIEPHELVQFILAESGQCERDAVNPQQILDLLDLQHVPFDFSIEKPDAARETGSTPRAILSFRDRLVGVDPNLSGNRARFSVLHEIGHYVLPSHQHMLFVCDDRGMSPSTRLQIEREANEFAADLLFQGGRFTLEANSQPITAATVKVLSEKYLASFEATARRIVERNFRPCMLVVFQNQKGQIDLDAVPIWSKKYTVASMPFRTKYFADLAPGVVPSVVAGQVTMVGCDIADSVVTQVSIPSPDGQERAFRAEFFSNTYNIFCLLTPSDSQSG